jgi:hypothetical protein
MNFLARLKAASKALVAPDPDNPELAINVSLAFVSFLCIALGAGWLCLGLYQNKKLSAAEAIALYGVFLLGFTTLLNSVTTVYALLQMKTAREQIKVTAFFERIRLTKAVLDDPKIVDAFRWFQEYLNKTPRPQRLTQTRLELHVQNRLAFSGLEDPEVSERSDAIVSTLTYVAQLSRHQALLDDLFFDRSALTVVEAYYCFQGIVDYSQQASFMTADVAGYARRAWQWLHVNSPDTLKHYPQIEHGFATEQDLKALSIESLERAQAIRNPE